LNTTSSDLIVLVDKISVVVLYAIVGILLYAVTSIVHTYLEYRFAVKKLQMLRTIGREVAGLLVSREVLGQIHRLAEMYGDTNMVISEKAKAFLHTIVASRRRTYRIVLIVMMLVFAVYLIMLYMQLSNTG